MTLTFLWPQTPTLTDQSKQWHLAVATKFSRSCCAARRRPCLDTFLPAGWLAGASFSFHGGAAGGAILSSAELRGGEKKKAELYLKFLNFGSPKLLPSPFFHLAQLHLCHSVGWLLFFILISGFFLLRWKGKKNVFDDIYFKLYRCSKWRKKKRERETPVVTATAHFCCRVEEKKE